MAPKKKKPQDELTALDNCCVIAGPDDIAEAQLKRAVVQFLGSSPKPGSKIVLHGKDATVQDLLSAIGTKILFCPKKVVILNRPTTEHKKAIIDNIVWIAGCQNTMLFVMPGLIDKDDKKTVFYTTFSKLNRLVECAPAVDQYGKPNYEQIANIQGWVQQEAAEKGLRIDEDGAEALMYLCGYNVGILESEIQRLMIYARTSGGVLTRDEIVNVVPSAFKTSTFTFRDYLERMDAVNAIRSLNLLVSSDDFNPNELVRWCQSRIHDLAIIRSYMELGLRDSGAVAEQWKKDLSGKGAVPHPYSIKLMMDAVSTIPTKKLVSMEALLFDIELAIRGYEYGAAKPPIRMLFSEFVLQYCHVSDPAFSF